MSKMSSTSFSSLSNDTIINIFSLLPLNDLVRVRRVCKSWCSLTTKVLDGINDNPILLFTCPSHPILHALNCNECSNDSSSSSSSPHTLEIMDYPLIKQQQQQPLGDDHTVFQILGSCNGLLCIRPGVDLKFCDSTTNNTIYIWNPSTREFKTVPEEPIEYPSDMFCSLRISYKFGCDRAMEDYKVIRTVHLLGGDVHLYREVKVYVLSTNSWRRINEDTLIPTDTPYLHRQQVHLNGSIHWVSNLSSSPLLQHQQLKPSFEIVSFNIEDEKYQLIPKPKYFDEDEEMFYLSAELHVLRGCLCIFYRDKNGMELWMMKDYGVKESWTKLFESKNSTLHKCWYLTVLWLCKNGKVLMKAEREDLILYDPEKDEAKYLRIDRNHIRNWSHVEIYIDNTMSLKS